MIDTYINNSLNSFYNNPDAGNIIKGEEYKLLSRQFVEKPIIYVGAGTCGLGAGANKTISSIKSYMQSHKIDTEIVEVGCIGLCAAEPIVDIQLPGFNRIAFGNITEEKVDSLMDSILNMEIPSGIETLYQLPIENARNWDNVLNFTDYPYFKYQKRLVLQNCGILNPVSIAEYISAGGYSSYLKTIKTKSSLEVCNMVEDSGLRGRGGGGFKTGTKWKFAHNTEADQKYLICNADEGDPGAFMDRAVIEGDPHRLLEGMMIAAFGIGASKSYVYIRAEYPLAIERLKIAIAQAKKYGLLGENIFGSGINFEIKVKVGAGAFVCGEETALINSVEGKRGMPKPRPPFPAIKGLFDKPTIINNVETLSCLAEIIPNGVDSFKAIGTEKSKGTKVFALSGKVKLTGLVEVPMGTTIRKVIFDIAGGVPNNKKFKSVQIGGPSGGCITEENLDIEVDYDSLLSIGAMMGSGGLVVMDEDTCMVDVAKFFMDFIQRESCGKCIPCREGTSRMLEILENITHKPATFSKNEALERFRGVTQLEKLGKVIKETSLCGLGQSAPNPVLSTIKWFRDEYEEHIFDRKCRANVCTELRTFKIVVDKCTGCTICAKKCPTDAIIGSRKSPHFIVEDKCISCGTCYDVCKFDSIVIS